MKKVYIKIIEDCTDCPYYDRRFIQCGKLNETVVDNLILADCHLQDIDVKDDRPE